MLREDRVMIFTEAYTRTHTHTYLVNTSAVLGHEVPLTQHGGTGGREVWGKREKEIFSVRM